MQVSNSNYSSPQKQNLRHQKSLPPSTNGKNTQTKVTQEVRMNSKQPIAFIQVPFRITLSISPTDISIQVSRCEINISNQAYSSEQQNRKDIIPLNDLQKYQQNLRYVRNKNERNHTPPLSQIRVKSSGTTMVSKQEMFETSQNENNEVHLSNNNCDLKINNNIDISKSGADSITPKYNSEKAQNRKFQSNSNQGSNLAQFKTNTNVLAKSQVIIGNENNPTSVISSIVNEQLESALNKKKKSTIISKITAKNLRASIYPTLNTQPMNTEAQKENDQQIQLLTQPALTKNIYRFIIGNGNNSQIVREILINKGGWLETQAHNQYFHFNWQPVSSGLYFDRLKNTNLHRFVVNHLEQHREISSKIRLIKNLESHCKIQQIYLFDITPVTYCIDYDSDTYESEFEDFISFFQSKSSNPAPDYVSVELLRRKNYYKNSFCPEKQVMSNLYKSKQSNFQGFSQPRSHFTMFKGHNLWMIKPADFNRGRGIKLFTSLQQLNRILQEYQDDNAREVIRFQSQFTGYTSKYSSFDKKQRSNSTHCSNKKIQKPRIQQRYVIQKYIESPLLIDERKFDIRMWVLISFDQRAFVFKEGYIRTACQSYDLSSTSINNNIIHLTNNAIQQHAQNYGQYEQGNQLSFKNFEDYITKKRINCNFSGKILPKIKDVMSLTIDSVRNKINPHDRKFCFEIFGYDFIIDNNFNPWLIEVNTNPCIEQSSDMLSILLKRMLDDGFKLTLDQLYNPHNKREESQYPVEGYSNKENLWQGLELYLIIFKEQLNPGSYSNLRGNNNNSLLKKK